MVAKENVWENALSRTPECPALEQLGQALQDSAPTDLLNHLDGCPSCRAELELMRSFSEGRPEAEEEFAVEKIVQRLDRPWIEPAPATPAVPSRETAVAWARFFRPAWLAAAAAVLVMAIGVRVALTPGARPVLTDPATGGILRSGELTGVTPEGTLNRVPAELSWQSIGEAASYRVSIVDVTGRVLWSAESTGSTLALPEPATALILPGRLLFWEIEALGPEGGRLASSGRVRFELRNLD